MRFLHTADWHAGKTLKGRSRLDELEAALNEMLEIAVREKVDCLLVAGDVFDAQAPPPEAERVVYRFFSELVARRIRAVVSGGNHDHPRRLAALKPLLDPLAIAVRGEVARPQDGGVVEFEARGERARIAVLPWAPEGKIVDAARLLAPDAEWYGEYAQRLERMIATLAAGATAQTVNVLTAHLFVMDADTSGSERAIHVARPYAVTAQAFPESLQYCALGHLHRPQEVLSPSRAVYAGSPLQLDFGEQGQRKRVVLADIRPGKPAHVESLPLTAGRRLREARGSLAELERRAAEFGGDYLKVIVPLDKPEPGIGERVRAILPNALRVEVELPGRPPEPQRPPAGTLSPRELFVRYYTAVEGAPPSDALTAAFTELLEEAHHAAG